MPASPGLKPAGDSSPKDERRKARIYGGGGFSEKKEQVVQRRKQASREKDVLRSESKAIKPDPAGGDPFNMEGKEESLHHMNSGEQYKL